MGDLKLFRVNDEGVEELEGHSVTVEKSLQMMLERNLEEFLGIRFLASEYTTGKRHAGRIDTLGIDENNSPVIIEYKRSMNENVINQGLFYLDWLLDHKAEFTLMVMQKYGKDAADSIDWSNIRLLCIAGGFTKYDEHAVQQINRNIELYQYAQYDNNLLLLDLVNAATVSSNDTTGSSSIVSDSNKSRTRSIANNLHKADEELTDLYENLRAFMLALGDDVQEKYLKNYIAFKRIKNFACLDIHPQSRKLLVYVKVNPESVRIEEGFTRDVRNIGHYGIGDLEIIINKPEDVEKAKELIAQSYDKN